MFKRPPPAKAHAFRHLQKSLIALLIVVCGNSSQICCRALLAAVWSSAMSEVCEMPDALHPAHDSQVNLVNLVAIHLFGVDK